MTPARKYRDWFEDFVRGKKEVPANVTGDEYAVHSVRRYVDNLSGIWEIAFTYASRLVVRTGKIAFDEITVVWGQWHPEPGVEIHEPPPAAHSPWRDDETNHLAPRSCSDWLLLDEVGHAHGVTRRKKDA